MITESQGHALPESNHCPVCLTWTTPGSALCRACGAVLIAGVTTLQLLPEHDTEPLSVWPTGDAILSADEPIILDIEQAQLLLPMTETLILGRASPTEEIPPDIDLSSYGASAKGVSREHALIRRGNYLLFVMDLGSTNGTLLNGRHLQPNHERLLRNGDILQLGQLQLRVRF